MTALVAVVAIAIAASSIEYLFYIIAKSWFARSTREIRAELWWMTAHITGPIFLLNHLSEVFRGEWSWYDPIILTANTLYWWFAVVKDKDKDDRWKKRRKKALAKVKEVAGKLVVVPLPSPA